MVRNYTATVDFPFRFHVKSTRLIQTNHCSFILTTKTSRTDQLIGLHSSFDQIRNTKYIFSLQNVQRISSNDEASKEVRIGFRIGHHIKVVRTVNSPWIAVISKVDRSAGPSTSVSETVQQLANRFFQTFLCRAPRLTDDRTSAASSFMKILQISEGDLRRTRTYCHTPITRYIMSIYYSLFTELIQILTDRLHSFSELSSSKFSSFDVI